MIFLMINQLIRTSIIHFNNIDSRETLQSVSKIDCTSSIGVYIDLYIVYKARESVNHLSPAVLSDGTATLNRERIVNINV